MTAGDMMTRVLTQLGEVDAGAAAPSAVYYGGPGELLNALNEAQRFFALLTLCLETTATLALDANAFYNMRLLYPDWLLPLRVEQLGGTRIRPARIQELDLLDSGWQQTPGMPARYCALGFDFFIVYPQPVIGIGANLTYARQPVPMQGSADTPEIPEQHHGDLVDYATYRVRAKEGGAEFSKGLTYFNRFLDGAQKYGDYVRARNRGTDYDKEPFELALFDRSRLMKAGSG